MISFVFSALDYSAPEKNQYRYRLEGFDRDWIHKAQFRQATYTNLPPGSYRFVVQAANNDGIWNRVGVTLPVRGTPAPCNWWDATKSSSRSTISSRRRAGGTPSPV